MSFLINDLHCHSNLSSCCHDERMTPDVILKFAEEHDYSAVCLTDHLWDAAIPGASKWYSVQDIDHVFKAAPLPKGKVPYYFGCETELPANCVPALAKENFDRFAFVVIPPNHMHMKGLVRPEGVDTPEKMAVLMEDRLEKLLECDIPFRKIGIAHLTCSLMFGEGSVADVVSHMNEARLLRIFKGYAQAGAGIELNAFSFGEWETRPEETMLIYRIAKEAGCLFYACSDAHSVEDLARVPDILPKLVKELDLTSADQYRIPV